MAEEEDHIYADKNQCSSSEPSLAGVGSTDSSETESDSDDSYVEDGIVDEVFTDDEDSCELRILDRSLEPYRHLLPVLSTLSIADKIELQNMLYRVGITAALSVSNFLEFESPNALTPPVRDPTQRPLQVLEDRYIEKYGKHEPIGPFGPHLVSMLFKYGIFEDCSEMVSQIREKMGELMGSGQLPQTTITENVENDIAAASLAAVSTSLHRNPPTHQLEILMNAATHEDQSTQECSETDSTSTCSKLDDPKDLYKGSLSSPLTLTDDIVSQGLMNPLPLDDEYERLVGQECDDDDLDDDDDDSDIDSSSLLHSIEDEEAGMMNQDYLLRFAAVMGYEQLLETLVKLGNTEFGTCRYSSPLLEACSAGQLKSVQILLAHDAEINAYTEQGNTPLIFACALGKIEVVKALLEVKSVDAFKRNSNGHDCLMEAACAGHIDIVKYLVENVFNEQFGHEKVHHLADGEKETALTLAAYKGYTDIVEYLLTCYIPSKQELYIALTETCIDGHFDIAKLLLDHDAPVNMKTETFDSPLSMAAGSGNAELVVLLIEKEANIELSNDDQYTPLMEACREGHLNLATIFLDTGARIDSITPNCETALTLAAARGSLPVVKLLLERGANLFLGNPSALYEAAQDGHKDVLQFLIHRLLEKRATQTKEVNEDLNKAFLVSVEMDHKELVEILVSTGVNLDYPGKEGKTALMSAARLGHKTMIKYLIDKGANVNIESSNKESTALSIAAFQGFHEIVQLLLDNGADCTRLLRDNVTCVLEAARHGHTQCVELLLMHYAKHQTTSKPSPISTIAQTGNSSTTSTANRTATTVTTPSSCTHHGEKITGHGPACQQMHQLPGHSPGHPATIGGCQHQHMHPRSSAAHRAARHKQKNKSQGTHGRDCPFHGCANGLPDDPAHLPISPACPDLHLQNYHHMQAAIAAGRSLMTRGRETLTDEQVKQFTDAVSSNMRNMPQGLVEAFDKPFDSSGDSSSSEHLPQESPRTVSASGAGVKRKSSGSKGSEGTIRIAQTSGPTKASNVAVPSLMSEKSLLSQTQFTSKDIREMFQLNAVAPPPALAAAVSACGFEPVTSTGTVTLSRNTSCSHPQEVKKQTHTFTTAPKGKLPTASISITATAGTACSKEVAKVTKGKRTIKSTKDMQKMKELQIASQKAQEKRRNTSDVVDIIDIQTESNHDTALTLACAGGYHDLVELLIRKGADVEHRDKKGFTPLVLAATGGHVECVKHLLEASCMVDAVSERTKDTALSLACSGGRKEVVELLLKANANKEHRNVSDYTPLSLAASGGYIEIIQLLLNAGAEINSRTGSKLCISPLMLAAMNGHEAATKLLLEKGSDINAHIETNRNTALTLACFQGRVEVVRLLLKFHANVEHRAKTGLTPLMEAANGGYSSVGQLLLEAGADPNASPVPSSRDTALTIAADKGHWEFVDLLIRHGANINARNKKGCTAVWLACNGGHLETLKTLVAHRADVDLQDARKASPLMTAFRKGHLKIIRYLVKHVQQFPGDAECHRYLSTLNNDKEKELEEKCRQCLQVVLSAKDKQAAQADAAAKRLLDMLAAEEEQEASRKRSKQKKNEEKRAKRQAKKAEELEAARLKEQQAAEEAEAKRKAKEEARKRAAEKLAKKKEEELLAAQKLAAAKAAEESAVKEEYDTEEEEDDEDEEQDETPYIVEPKFEELEKNYDWTDVDPKDKKELESFAAARARRLVKTPKSSSTLAAPVKSANASPKSETESEWCKAGAPKKKVVPVAKPATKAAAGAAVKAESDDGGVWNNIESSKRRQQVMNLASNQIARVIGRGGTNINTIREATNANIEVEKQLSSRNQGPRNITIKGNAEAVRNAVAMIDILLKEVDLGINQVVARVLQTKHSSSPCPMKSNSAGDQSSEVGADSKQGQSNVWEQRAAIRQGIQKDDIPNEVPVSVSKAPSSTASFDHTEVERVSPVPSVIHAAPIDTFVPPMEDPVPEVVPLPTPDDFSKRKAPGSERASNSATPVTNGEHSHLISPIGAPSAFKTIEPPFPHKITTPAQEVPSLPQPSRLDPLFKSAVNVDVGNIIPRFNSMSVNKMLNSTSTKDENQLAANLFESKLSDIWGSDRTTDLSSTLSNRLGNGGLVDPISAVWMNKDDEPSYNKPSQLPQNQSYDYNVPSYSRPKETTSFTPWSNGSNVPSAQDWSSPASNRHSTWDPLMPSNVNNNKYNPAGSSQSRFDQSGSRQGLSDSLRMGDSYDLNQKLRKDIYSSNPFASQQPQQQQSIGHMRMNQSMDLRRNMYGGYDSSNYHHQQQSMNVQQPSHDMFDTFQSPAVDRSSGLSSYYNPQQQHMNRQSFMSSSQTQQPMRGGNGMHSNFGSIGDPMHSSSSIRAPSQNQQQYGMNSSSFYMPQQSENPRGSGVRDMPMQYGAGTSNVPTNTLYDTWSNPTTQPSSQNQIWSNGSSSGSRNIW